MTSVPFVFQEKRVDKATLEMEPEYPSKYFDDLAADLCTSKTISFPKMITDRFSFLPRHAISFFFWSYSPV